MKNTPELPQDKWDEFKDIGRKMMEDHTGSSNMEEHELTETLIQSNWGALTFWLKWWLQRHKHFSWAFKQINAPDVNKAEVGPRW